jgi:gamma-glutamyltranspeptidase/glutathione hydrolase
VALHNRGSSFSLQPGHPAEYGPGRRPPHTLTPTLLTDGAGSLRASVATRGGHIQPQVLLQVLSRICVSSESPADALAAGRFAVAGDEVALEGHAPRGWFEGLAARGHRVVEHEPFEPDFGQAQLIVDSGDHLAGASDPRSKTWGVAAL